MVHGGNADRVQFRILWFQDRVLSSSVILHTPVTIHGSFLHMSGVIFSGLLLPKSEVVIHSLNRYWLRLTVPGTEVKMVKKPTWPRSESSH